MSIDLCMTTLFLHHFNTETLPVLMQAIARHADAFVACEPSRGVLARIGSQLIGMLGTNRVTREDAVKSVHAGFLAQELTSMWPQVNETWVCEEYPAWPFSHCFTAVRKDVYRG